MKNEVTELKQNIESLDELREKLALKKVDFDRANEDLYKKIEGLSEEQVSLKEQIKSLAVVEFKETGNKKLFGGIGIREGTSLDYDEKLALDWAKKHELCLSLNKRDFEKIAKTQDIEFVKQEEKITVTFPKIIKT